MKQVRQSMLFALTLFTWANVAHADWPVGDFWAKANESEVSYDLVHKFHKVRGASKVIEGRAVLKAEEGEVMIRINAASFDSGNENRDAHAKEVIEAHKFPFIVFRGKVSKGETSARVKGSLEFHGVTNPIETEIPFRLENSRLLADIDFPIKLTDYRVERPSLLFVAVDDEVRIRGKIEFEKSP